MHVPSPTQDTHALDKTFESSSGNVAGPGQALVTPGAWSPCPAPGRLPNSEIKLTPKSAWGWWGRRIKREGAQEARKEKQLPSLSFLPPSSFLLLLLYCRESSGLLKGHGLQPLTEVLRPSCVTQPSHTLSLSFPTCSMGLETRHILSAISSHTAFFSVDILGQLKDMSHFC